MLIDMFTARTALLANLPPDAVITVIVLAVIIAPLIYRWRLRLRRWLRRLGWLALGFALAVTLL